MSMHWVSVMKTLIFRTPLPKFIEFSFYVVVRNAESKEFDDGNRIAVFLDLIVWSSKY
jgi:hypothetical protein